VKIFINKKISEIHWSAFVAAGLCFVATFFCYKDYKDIKLLFENGAIEEAIVRKIPENCGTYSRGKKYLQVNIVVADIEKKLPFFLKECEAIHLNDTILVRYLEPLKIVAWYKPNEKSFSKKDFYFAISSFILGLIFLLFGNNKNTLFQTP
jgi:hypothetical protein